MADAFISYRRKPSASTAHLLQKGLQGQYHFDIYLDTTRTDSAKVHFPDRLLGAIDTSKVFICLLADTTLDSEWVLREIERAYQQQKPCIPVFQESYKPLALENPAVDYLLSFDGVHMMDERGLYMDEAVQQIANIVKKTTSQPRERRGVYFAALALVTLALAAAFLIFAPRGNEGTLSENTPDTAAQAQTETPTNTTAPTEESTPADEPSATPTDAPTFTPTTTNAPTFTSTPTDAPSSTPTDQPTFTPTVSPTIAPTDEPSPSVEQVALTPVTRNADWTPAERDFDGVTMVLVPPGCFMMGSTDFFDEQPVENYCFNRPFWIDKYEVTNAAYGSLGCADWSSEPNQPRNCVNWFDARNFCEARGARLPTEAEWEYAARGPDALVYPWGNEFVEDNVVYSGNSNNHPADVGSLPAGASWVGALDMSGNFDEWTSSLYKDYPYGEDHESNSDDSVERVVRGGSYNSPEAYLLGAAYRNRVSPDYGISGGTGFRCARSNGTVDTQISTNTSPTETAVLDVPSPTEATSSEGPTPVPVYAVVNVTSANLRSGPSTNFERVASVTQGTRLLIIAEGGYSERWYLVQHTNGDLAWIVGSTVNLEPQSASINPAATLPPEPITSLPATYSGTGGQYYFVARADINVRITVTTSDVSNARCKVFISDDNGQLAGKVGWETDDSRVSVTITTRSQGRHYIQADCQGSRAATLLEQYNITITVEQI